MSLFVAVVGMPGSGKSVLSDALVDSGFQYVRFGQIVIDKLKEENLEINEKNERSMREGLRKQYGMGAMAVLNIPKFDELLKKGNVVGDGMYSWSEYKLLKERYGHNAVVVAIHASPSTRYARLENRGLQSHDKDHRYRPITREQAKTRDFSEIENLEKGGTLAMADYHVVNEGSKEELQQAVAKFLEWLHERK